jgi:transposase InsO family protein
MRAYATNCSMARFYTLREAQVIIESWRQHYNAIRPHASLGYKPPAPEVFGQYSPRGQC